jgi:hypothetical protein
MTTTTSTVTPPSNKESEGGVFAAILMTILIGGTILIILNSRALTPDFIDRANADGPDGWLILTTTAVMLSLGALGFIGLMRQWILTTLMATPLMWFSMIYTMACIMPSDHDGEWNRYTRAMDPLPQQFEDLAEAKQLPDVAALIRKASSDGRIDRGEAYDILHSPTYYDASAEKWRRDQEETRRKALAP